MKNCRSDYVWMDMLEIALMHITNIVIACLFAQLAIHFGKWWIILFDALFFTTYKKREKTEPGETADRCTED